MATDLSTLSTVTDERNYEGHSWVSGYSRFVVTQLQLQLPVEAYAVAFARWRLACWIYLPTVLSATSYFLAISV